MRLPVARWLPALLLTALGAHAALAADTVRLGKAVGIAWTFLAADVGVKTGLFAHYDINVDISAFGGDAKMQQALAAGSLDLGLGSGPSMAFAAKGAPVIAVAAFADEPRDISVIVGPDSSIKSVADLKGKLVAISTAGSLTDWLVKRIAVTEGWGPGGIRTAAIGGAGPQTAALRAHEVDALMGSTDNGFKLEERHEARVLVGMERFVPHFVTHVVFARRALVAEKPALIERFLKGFFAAIAYIKTHKAETIAIARPIQHESDAVLSKAQDHEMPMMILDGEFDPQGLKLLKQSFTEMGILKRAPADDQILTRRFLPVRP